MRPFQIQAAKLTRLLLLICQMPAAANADWNDAEDDHVDEISAENLFLYRYWEQRRGKSWSNGSHCAPSHLHQTIDRSHYWFWSRLSDYNKDRTFVVSVRTFQMRNLYEPYAMK